MPRSEIPAHIQLAEMVLRRAQKSVRGKVSSGIKKNVSGVVGKKAGASPGLGQAALMLGISRLASRSVPGALLVGGGYLAKKWLDKRQQSDRADPNTQ